MTKTPLAALADVPDYKQHPLAVSLMPGGMNPEEFEAFCDDIQERGILFPVTIYEGMVLDGWHRYRAAVKTGTALKTVEYTGKDPAGYIAACNVLRRKLSSLQRALVGARMHLEHAVTQASACKRLGISNTVLTMVLKAIDSRNTVIINRIESDSDYTRGMLREDLEDAGLVHSNYGKSRDPDDVRYVEQAPVTTKAPNSVFAMGDMATTDGTDQDDDEDLIGDDKPLPAVGKKNSHPERRSKDTPAQSLQERFQELLYDEKCTFVQMVWAEIRPLAEELGLPGLQATQAAQKAVSAARSKARKTEA